MGTLWTLLGVGNQLLAVIALTVATTWLINIGKIRYAWVTLLPLTWVATTTLTAGYLSVTGPYWRMVHEPASRLMGLLCMRGESSPWPCAPWPSPPRPGSGWGDCEHPEIPWKPCNHLDFMRSVRFEWPPVRARLILLFPLLGSCTFLLPSLQTPPPCPPDTVLCDNLTCSDLQTDPFNCGFCGNVCGQGLSCKSILDGGGRYDGGIDDAGIDVDAGTYGGGRPVCAPSPGEPTRTAPATTGTSIPPTAGRSG